jgi:hypothetical protein
LYKKELIFAVEGDYNDTDYEVPQYDINTTVYIKQRKEEVR